MTYKMAFPPRLSVIYPIFHISMLQKYVLDDSHVVSLDSIVLGTDSSFEEEPIEILDRHVSKIRTMEIAPVKGQWKHYSVGEVTWETESVCVHHILEF